jgi:hypothetical protein
MIDVTQPAKIGTSPAIYTRTDSLGADVALYYCVQDSLEIHPFKLDGTPYTALEITGLGLSGSESPAPLVNAQSSVDVLYLVNRRGAYSVVRDLDGPSGEAKLLGNLPDGIVRVSIATENGAPVAVVDAEVMDVDSTLT